MTSTPERFSSQAKNYHDETTTRHEHLGNWDDNDNGNNNSNSNGNGNGDGTGNDNSNDNNDGDEPLNYKCPRTDDMIFYKTFDCGAAQGRSFSTISCIGTYHEKCHESMNGKNSTRTTKWFRTPTMGSSTRTWRR